MGLTVCYYHVTYKFQSKSTLYSLPECQGLLARSRHHIWSLIDSNKIQTHNHLVRKKDTQPFSKTGQMIELCCEYLPLRCIWLYVIIMSHKSFRVTLLYNLPECQGTPCSKQAPYLKFKWHSGKLYTCTWCDNNKLSNAW